MSRQLLTSFANIQGLAVSSSIKTRRCFTRSWLTEGFDSCVLSEEQLAGGEEEESEEMKDLEVDLQGNERTCFRLIFSVLILQFIFLVPCQKILNYTQRKE
jgi:hypothetical protein